MLTSMRKIIWPRAPLSTAPSPAGAEESEGEQRQPGATDHTPDTSPLPSKPPLERSTRDTQRVTRVPTGDRSPRTRELVLGTRRSHPTHRKGDSSPPAARSLETRRPPPLSRGGGRSARANPHFFAPPVTRGREGEQSRERGRLRGDPAEGRRRARECAVGRAAPTTRRSRSRPLPLTCRGRPEDSYHRHLLDRELREGRLADIQPRQRAGHVVVGSHYPHRKHVRRRRRRHRLPSTQRPGSSGGGGLRRGASSPSSSVRLPPASRPSHGRRDERRRRRAEAAGAVCCRRLLRRSRRQAAGEKPSRGRWVGWCRCCCCRHGRRRRESHGLLGPRLQLLLP